ncbi:hypothetical protein F5879DRAFT_52442 [Lentinula edodes]|nr:hypothetical protein F5879DRAFT_52442 [Lentinula edodes]
MFYQKKRALSHLVRRWGTSNGCFSFQWACTYSRRYWLYYYCEWRYLYGCTIVYLSEHVHQLGCLGSSNNDVGLRRTRAYTRRFWTDDHHRQFHLHHCSYICGVILSIHFYEHELGTFRCRHNDLSFRRTRSDSRLHRSYYHYRDFRLHSHFTFGAFCQYFDKLGTIWSCYLYLGLRIDTTRACNQRLHNSDRQLKLHSSNNNRNELSFPFECRWLSAAFRFFISVRHGDNRYGYEHSSRRICLPCMISPHCECVYTTYGIISIPTLSALIRYLHV